MHRPYEQLAHYNETRQKLILPQLGVVLFYVAFPISSFPVLRDCQMNIWYWKAGHADNIRLGSIKKPVLEFRFSNNATGHSLTTSNVTIIIIIIVIIITLYVILSALLEHLRMLHDRRRLQEERRIVPTTSLDPQHNQTKNGTLTLQVPIQLGSSSGNYILFIVYTQLPKHSRIYVLWLHNITANIHIQSTDTHTISKVNERGQFNFYSLKGQHKYSTKTSLP